MKRLGLCMLACCLILAGCASSTSERTTESVESLDASVEERQISFVKSETLEERLTGYYQSVNGPTDEYMFVSVHAGIVLLDIYNEDFDYYCMKEFYPVDEGILESDSTLMDVITYQFGESVMQKLVSVYTDDLLYIDSEDGSEEYEKIDTYPAYLDRYANIEMRHNCPSALTGKWKEQVGDHMIHYLELLEDGSFFYYGKEKDLSASILVGKWTYLSDSEEIVLAGTFMGKDSSNLSSYAFKASMIGDALCLLDFNDSGLLYMNEMNAEKVDDDYEIPAEMYTQDIVYSRIYEKDRYTTSDGSVIDYAYRIPQIQMNSPEITALNEQLYETYSMIVNDDRTRIFAKEPIAYRVIDYEYAQINDLVSLVIYEEHYPFANRTYQSYYIDADTETLVSDEEVLTMYGYDTETFLSILKNLARERFEVNYKTEKEENESLYQMIYDNIDSYITLHQIAFYPVNENDIFVYVPLASFAQNGYEYELLILEGNHQSEVTTTIVQEEIEMMNYKDLSKKDVTFHALPKTYEEFIALPQASMSDPFDTAAMTVVAFAVYPENKEEALKMLNYLRGPRELSTYDKQFIKDRFMDSDYVPRSYFNGATPANHYEVSAPYTITVFTNPYSYKEENYANLYMNSGGADSPRSVTLRLAKDGKWYLWEQYILVGIRIPESQNPWA